MGDTDSDDTPNYKLDKTKTSICNRKKLFNNENNNQESRANRNKQKSSLTCMICCDRQIEVVFLTCGHQLACLKCAEKIDHCPICRTQIETKVRTYFAYVD